MKKILLAIIFWGLTNAAFSQMIPHPINKVSALSSSLTTPAIEWQNTIGGNLEDELFSIQQTADGGYILGGRSESDISGDKTENSNGYDDFWIVKTDALGNIQWQNTIGGNNSDLLYSIQQTTDGGYILGGVSASNISGDKTENNWDNTLATYDYWIVKTDSSGIIQWQNTIGGNDDDCLFSVQQTTDGGYILGGYSLSGVSGDKTENSIGNQDYWIVKTDASGNIQWQNTIGGNGNDWLYCLQQTADGGYILGGWSASNISGDKTENSIGMTDYWIVKTDASGNIQWQNTIGGSNNDVLYSLQQTADGGYILGGWSLSNISGDKTENCFGLYDYWIVKTDSSGNIQWQNTIGGSNEDVLYSIKQTTDGGYIFGGLSYSNVSGDKTENCLGVNDYWVVKTDASGNIQWQNTIGGNDYDVLLSIRQTADGGYILGGYSSSDISGDKTENPVGGGIGFYDYWIVKLASDSVPLCSTAPMAISINTNDTICPGQSVTLTKVGGALSANGAFYWYANSCGGTSLGTGNSNTFSPTVTTTYYVRAEDTCGVTACASVTITVNPLPFPAITGNTTICQGNSTTLNAGSGYTSYLWSTAAATQVINVTSAGVYTVTVTNAFACTGSASITVTVNPLPIVNLGPDVSICAGNSVQLSATGFATYLWSTGANTSTINVSTAGTYTVTVTDGNGCTGSDIVTVTVNPILTPNVTIGVLPAGTICYGTNVTFTATPTNGGVTPAYQWQINGVNVGTNSNTFSSSTLANGDVITVILTSNALCVSQTADTSNAITMTVTPIPSAIISGNANICIGSCTNISVVFTGILPFTYSYSNGTTTFGPFTTSSSNTTINVCPTVSTTYTLTAISDADCQGTVSGSAIITVNPNPLALITPSATVFMCADDIAHFTANTGAGYTYQWYKNSIAIGGAVTSFYDATANGLYSFVVTDLNGCFGTSSSTQVQIICQPADTNLGLRMSSVSDNDIVLVPNPASTEITIHSENIIQAIVIYDAMGQKVFSMQLTEQTSNFKLQTSNFPDGIYFVEVINGKQKSINKFIKN